jgi:hypothetical protein
VGGTGRDGPRSRVYVPETRAYHSYNKRREQTALDPRYLRRSPPCSLHFGLHTSFAHSTAYTAHTRHGFTHRDTESVPHTEQSPSGPSQPPPVANLSSLYPPRTHVKSILAPPARAAHTLLGAALGARRLRMARCAYTKCARRRPTRQRAAHFRFSTRRGPARSQAGSLSQGARAWGRRRRATGGTWGSEGCIHRGRACLVRVRLGLGLGLGLGYLGLGLGLGLG